jgi:hypothetical protein
MFATYKKDTRTDNERGLAALLDDVQRAVAAWEGCHSPAFKTHFYELAAIMDAIAAHPLVGSRAALPRPVVPSSQPLPGATPISRSAGQGAAFAAYQDWPEDD